MARPMRKGKSKLPGLDLGRERIRRSAPLIGVMIWYALLKSQSCKANEQLAACAGDATTRIWRSKQNAESLMKTGEWKGRVV
jgi:hypothetical protein